MRPGPVSVGSSQPWRASVGDRGLPAQEEAEAVLVPSENADASRVELRLASGGLRCPACWPGGSCPGDTGSRPRRLDAPAAAAVTLHRLPDHPRAGHRQAQ